MRSSKPLVAALVVASVIATFWPVVGHDFTNWDDSTHLTRNPRFLPPRLENIPKYWTERSFFGLYIPMTYAAWTVVGIAGSTETPDADGNYLNPYVFHAANLLLHLAAALLVLWILWMIFPDASPWATGVGAMVFALHPVQVESVAWVSGFRDVFAGVLCLASVALFLRFSTDSKHRRVWWMYALATIVYALALLSKPTAVVVPVIAGVIAVGLQRRSIRRTSLALLPWVLLAVPCVILTKLAQPLASEAIVVPLWQRPLIALDALAFYLFKVALPFGLAPDYGRNPDAVRSAGSIAWTWILPVGAGIAIWMYRRRARPLAIGAIVFAAALLPVLGLVTFDYQHISTVADHYLYLAMLGPAIACAWLVARIGQAAPARAKLRVGASVVLVVLAVISFAQTWVWADSETLFTHTLSVNPNSWIAHSNLAAIYNDRKRYDLAARAARRAIELKPGHAEAHGNLAVALDMTGRKQEALAEYQTVLRIDPNSIPARLNLAALYAELRQPALAREQYEAVLRLESDNPIARAALRPSRP